jgi:hypothetical protein
VGNGDQAISYKVLRRGTPVRSADGVELGKVRRVQEAKRENIFDGIVIDTAQGTRFVDAPEVARIEERAVTLTFPAAQADQYIQPVCQRGLTGSASHTSAPPLGLLAALAVPL